MNETEYKQKFKNAKNQAERDEINAKYTKSIHYRNLRKKFFKSFKECLPILDFILAMIAIVISLIK